jgi:hypothetical protein
MVMTRKLQVVLLLTVSLLWLSSCDQIIKMLETGVQESSLTQSEVVQGLKEALITGTNTSTTELNAKDGYLKNSAVRIMLPKEAQEISENIRRIPGLGDKAMDDLLLRINRSAEDAASEAKPIFIKAVKDMTIREGMDILKGKSSGSTGFDSTAATVYLKQKTYEELYNAFQPKVNASLNKKIVGNVSTNEAWAEITRLYNKVAPILGKSKVNTELSGYVTEKALEGLFYKIGEEEKSIRKNPYQYSKDILRKVFGSVHK